MSKLLHRACTAAFVPLLLGTTILGTTVAAEPLPSRLQGSWRISRVLPTTNNACWGRTQAEPLLGSTLTYHDDALRWRGGSVPLEDITTRIVTDADFRKENAGEQPASFAQLATTEGPGDSVLLAGPNRIVVSACGVYFEATRPGGLTHTSLGR